MAKITVLLTALVLAATPMAASAQAPKASKGVMFLTAPSAGTLSSIRIASKGIVKLKTLPGNVQIQLKLSNVVDGADQSVTNINNTLQIDVLIGGAFSTINHFFDLVGGETDPSTAKLIISNGSLPGAPSAGAPMEVVGVRVRESGTGHIFGSAGLTLR